MGGLQDRTSNLALGGANLINRPEKLHSHTYPIK
jgi:hypothetical protein